MSLQVHVRYHPLGVVVFQTLGELGELLIPGEDWCGISVEELRRIAETVGVVTVPKPAPVSLPPCLQA